jgi:hypothetical protein
LANTKWLSRFLGNRKPIQKAGQTLIIFYIFSVGGAVVIILALINAALMGLFWPVTYCIV